MYVPVLKIKLWASTNQPIFIYYVNEIISVIGPVSGMMQLNNYKWITLWIYSNLHVDTVYITGCVRF